MLKLKDFMNLEELQNIQDQFSDSTGLAAIAVDMDGNYITRGSNFTDFCMKYTRGSAEGSKRCIKCDTECSGTYFCHAGLMDFSADILVEGEKVGAVIGGQVLPNKPDEEQFRVIARELGVNEEEYIRALHNVPIRSERMIRASANMLGNIINQLVNLEYFKIRNQKKITIFDREIATSLKSVNDIKSSVESLQKLASMQNILAINASIEAARAGVAGKGFTVVAREFGELSSNSGEVYNEIKDGIKIIERSVLAMEEA